MHYTNDDARFDAEALHGVQGAPGQCIECGARRGEQHTLHCEAEPDKDHPARPDCHNCGGDGFSCEGGKCPACDGLGHQ